MVSTTKSHTKAVKDSLKTTPQDKSSKRHKPFSHVVPFHGCSNRGCTSKQERHRELYLVALESDKTTYTFLLFKVGTRNSVNLLDQRSFFLVKSLVKRHIHFEARGRRL